MMLDDKSPRSADKQAAYHMLIHGEVTGVGFRFSAIREARRYSGLHGYIRNKDYYTVECVVQGPEPDVSRFVDWLKTGPRSARVRDVDVESVSVDPDRRPFQVTR